MRPLGSPINVTLKGLAVWPGCVALASQPTLLTLALMRSFRPPMRSSASYLSRIEASASRISPMFNSRVVLPCTPEAASAAAVIG